MKHKKINIPIYDWDLLYCHMEVGDDVEPYFKMVNKLGLIPADADEFKDYMARGIRGGGKCYINDEDRKLVVMIYPTLSPPNFYSSVAHEVYHCAFAINEHANVNDEEATAYLIGHIWECLHSKIEP